MCVTERAGDHCNGAQLDAIVGAPRPGRRRPASVTAMLEQYVSSDRGEWAILVYRIDGDRDRLVEMDLYTLAHEGSP